MLKRQTIGDLAAALRASYWFVPAVLTAVAVALSGGLIYLDHNHPRTPSGLEAFFLPASVEGSRALLSAIVSSMMTVVAVTFSVTVVALTVASQHYGPRLLNTFMRDRTVQVVLGLLIATFAYSVLVLGSIQGDGDGERPLYWATGGAILLVGCSVVALIVFVQHVTTSLQVSSVALQITRDFDDALAVEAGEPRGSDSSAAVATDDFAASDEVRGEGSGYVQRINEAGLCRLAAEHDVQVSIVRPPGKYVFPGVVIARVTPRGRVNAAFSRQLNAVFLLGKDRTTRHDLEFAIKQLVEIALRGLSPGVNEPFTALVCIDRLGQVLAAVAARDGEAISVLRDDRGIVRAILRRQAFEAMARAAFDPIRIFAGSNPAVYARLLDTMCLLAETITRREYLDVLVEEAGLVMSAAEREVSAAADVDYVRRRFEHALGALEARRAPQAVRVEEHQHG